MALALPPILCLEGVKVLYNDLSLLGDIVRVEADKAS